MNKKQIETLRRLQPLIPENIEDETLYVNHVMVSGNTGYITNSKHSSCDSWFCITFPVNVPDGLYYPMNGLLIENKEIQVLFDYPVVKKSVFFGNKYDFNISLREIRNLLKIHRDSNCYFQDQVFIDGENRNVVASDGHCLYMTGMDSNIPETSGLINCEHLRKFMNLFNIKKTEKVMINDRFFSFIFGDIALTVKKSDKKFVNYMSVLPDNNYGEHYRLFNIKELKNLNPTHKRTFLNHRDCKNKGVLLKIERKEFVFYFIHRYKKSILKLKTGIKTGIKNFEIALNISLLLKAIQIIKEGDLIFHSQGSIFSITNQKKETFLFMPVNGDINIKEYKKKYQLVESNLGDYNE